MSKTISVKDKYDLPCMIAKSRGEDARPCPAKEHLRYLQRIGVVATITCYRCGKTMTVQEIEDR